MGNSMEIRSPMIDYKLVEFVSSLPLDMKYKANEAKFFLKEVLSGIVPNYILYAQKRGFTPPLDFINQMNKSYQYKMIKSDFVFFNSMLADRILNLNTDKVVG
jgi:asparagine synthase (glutamine-hydrolysing)